MMKRFAILAALTLSTFSAQAEEKKEEQARPYTILLEASGKEQPATPEEVDQIKTALDYRLNAQEDIRYQMKAKGQQITVTLAETTKNEAAEIAKALIKPSKLTIHKRHPQHSPELAEQVFKKEKVIPGARAYPQTVLDENGNLFATQHVLVESRPALTGKDIKHTQPNYATNTEVVITLTDEGAKKMESFTRSLTPRKDHIVSILDGKVMNDAVLMAEVLSKHFAISGLDDIEECKRVSTALDNPLENEVKIISITPAE